MRKRRRHCLATSLALWGVVGAAVQPAGAFSTGDLRALWLLDEGTGQVLVDSKGNNTKGTLGSAAGVDNNDPTWIPGPVANTFALRFDGDDFVDIRSSPTLESDSVTLGAVVRGFGSPGQYRYIAGKGASACEVASYALYTGPTGGLFFYVSNGQAFTLSPDAGAGVWDGAWHRVVGTFDGSMVRLYVDGQQVGEGSPSTVSIDYRLPTSVRFSIGAYRGSCDLYFRGDIAAVTVLRTAVSASELAAVGSLMDGK